MSTDSKTGPLPPSLTTHRNDTVQGRDSLIEADVLGCILTMAPMIWEGTIMIYSKAADLRAYETGQDEVQNVGDEVCWGDSGKQRGTTMRVSIASPLDVTMVSGVTTSLLS